MYDGDCPFCDNYVRLLRLKDSVGDLRLINAREHLDLAGVMRREGYNLDNGMLLQIDGKKYYDFDCVYVLALLSSDVGLFNKVNGWVFRSKSRARLLYPVLKAGRSLVLTLLRRDKLFARTNGRGNPTSTERRGI